MKTLSLAVIAALGLCIASTAQAQYASPEFGIPTQIQIATPPGGTHTLCQFEILNGGYGGLPIWYGVPIETVKTPVIGGSIKKFENFAECETVSRAIEDHASVSFYFDGNNEDCLIPNCQNARWAGTSQVIEVRLVTRDASTRSIRLVVGGPPVHVTVNDENGVPISPSQYTWGGIPTVSITPDTTGYLFQATQNICGSNTDVCDIEFTQASPITNSQGNPASPLLSVAFIAPPPQDPVAYIYTSP